MPFKDLAKAEAEAYRKSEGRKKIARKASKKWRKNNPGAVKTQWKNWYRRNKKHRKTYKQKYHKVHPEKRERQWGRWYRTHQQNWMCSQAKRRAKNKRLSFDLRPDDIVIPKRCPVFGFILKISKGRFSDRSPSLDRIDPTKGYIKNNIKVISWSSRYP